jgi:hypothetical protein
MTGSPGDRCDILTDDVGAETREEGILCCLSTSQWASGSYGRWAMMGASWLAIFRQLPGRRPIKNLAEYARPKLHK